MTALNESDARALRRCFGQFGTGVTVITTQIGDERAGVTANSFSSLSLDPPLVLWSIKRTSRSFGAFEKAEHFAVNILSADQINVSQAFSGPQTDKFAGLDFIAGKTGSPTVPSAIAVIECQVKERLDGGDHIIIIGRVLHFSESPGNALLFCQGRYAVAIDHPSLKTPNELEREAAGESNESKHTFWRKMYVALQSMSRRFERHRQEEGVSPEQWRVLADVFDTPGCTIDELVKISFLPHAIAEDAIAALSERGDLSRDGKGVLRLTEQGMARRRAIGARWKLFEDRELAGIDERDLERTRKVLDAIAARRNENS